jgi:flagellar L-ring protein precursor FlgH
MPMPAPEMARPMANSLWRPGSRAFFKDLRANRVGDVLTVTIDIQDKAELKNETKRTRINSDNLDINSLFGFAPSLNTILPEAVNPADLLSTASSTSNVGTGEIKRNETIVLKLAATVVQILPNGNLVIHGRQETRINFEVRELQVTGIIRPEDIASDNSITYEKIAEARVAYGGRGHITDVQQPRYGSQILDILMPF